MFLHIPCITYTCLNHLCSCDLLELLDCISLLKLIIPHEYLVDDVLCTIRWLSVMLRVLQNTWEYHLCRYPPPRNFTRSSFNVTNRWFSNRARHHFSVMVSPLRNRAMFRVSSELIKPTTLMFSHVGVRHKDQLTMIRWQYRQCTGLCLPGKCISTIFTAGITDSFYCISISIWYYNLNN